MDKAEQTADNTLSRQQRTVYGFAYIFLVMSSYYILKPVRDSYFLHEQGYRNVPWVHLLVLGVTLIAVTIYTRATRILSPSRLIFATNLFFLGSILSFWLVLTQWGHVAGLRATMAWVYFCWVGVFSVFAVTIFWSVIHSTFTAKEGALSYGHIGAGATCGAMTGGGLTYFLAEKIGTEQLLLVALLVLAPCLGLGRILAKLAQSPNVGRAELTTSPTDSSKYRSAVRLLRRSTYLSSLAAIVFLWLFIMVLEEYRCNQIIQSEIGNRHAKAAFFGSIHFYANMIGLFLSLVVSGPALSRWGSLPGLVVFAGFIILTGVAFLIAPGLRVVSISLVALHAWGYSIGQWSRELLYTKTSPEDKFVAKGFIDTFIFRAGTGMASIFLILAAQVGDGEDGLLTNAVTQLSLITIPLGLVLMALMWWISRRFDQLPSISFFRGPRW